MISQISKNKTTVKISAYTVYQMHSHPIIKHTLKISTMWYSGTPLGQTVSTQKP